MKRSSSRRVRATPRRAAAKKPDNMDVRQKTKDLIELVANGGAPADERSAAAIQACAIIRKYDLLASPLDAFSDNKTVKAAQDVFETLRDPSFTGGLKTLIDGFKGLGGKR